MNLKIKECRKSKIKEEKQKKKQCRIAGWGQAKWYDT